MPHSKINLSAYRTTCKIESSIKVKTTNWQYLSGFMLSLLWVNQINNIDKKLNNTQVKYQKYLMYKLVFASAKRIGPSSSIPKLDNVHMKIATVLDDHLVKYQEIKNKKIEIIVLTPSSA